MTYLRDASEQIGYSAEQLGKFADKLAADNLITKKSKKAIVNGKKRTYYDYRLTAQSDCFLLTYRDYDLLISFGTTELAIGVSLMESHDSAEYWETSGRKLAAKWNMDHKTVLKTINTLESAKFLSTSKKGRGFALRVSPRFVSYKWEFENGSKHYVSAEVGGV